MNAGGKEKCINNVSKHEKLLKEIEQKIPHGDVVVRIKNRHTRHLESELAEEVLCASRLLFTLVASALALVSLLEDLLDRLSGLSSVGLRKGVLVNCLLQVDVNRVSGSRDGWGYKGRRVSFERPSN